MTLIKLDVFYKIVSAPIFAHTDLSDTQNTIFMHNFNFNVVNTLIATTNSTYGGIIISKKNHTTTMPGFITIREVVANLGS